MTRRTGTLLAFAFILGLALGLTFQPVRTIIHAHKQTRAVPIVKIQPDGTKEHFLAGKRHRQGGPAIEFADGSKEWWHHGAYQRSDPPRQAAQKPPPAPACDSRDPACRLFIPIIPPHPSWPDKCAQPNAC